MICRNLVFVIIITVSFSGCNTPKKLQRTLGFSDDCLESYQYFKDRITRKGEDRLLEFIEPTAEVYQDLLTEYYEKESPCWLGTLPEKAVIELFGIPHKRGGGDRDQSILYYIRTEECMSLKEPHRLDERCGTLMFVFSKEGEPIGGAFYAWKPAKME